MVEMELWDRDYIDVEVPGHITLNKDGFGEFQFGYVACEIDWDYDFLTGRVEFTFDGFDELAPTNGRGWARIDGKQMLGEIAFHLGDRSAFMARKASSRSADD